MAKRFAITEQPEDKEKAAFINELKGITYPRDMFGALMDIGDTIILGGGQWGASLFLATVIQFNYLIEDGTYRFTSISAKRLGKKGRRLTGNPRESVIMNDETINQMRKHLKSKE
jgi:hypothetical protein